MGYTYYEPLNVWLDPASIPDVVSYIQKYLSENPISNESEIETIISEYITAHPEIIGVQSVNGETGEVVLDASDINTSNNLTIQSVLNSISEDISGLHSTFVTPEMYGAVGDGVTDDTLAIQSAINSGVPIIVMSKNYATTQTIVIDRSITLIHAGELTYTGNNSAVIIKDINNLCDLHFGRIIALNGNGIEFYATAKEGTTQHRVQYVDLYFNGILAGDKCIYMNLDVESGLSADNVGWLNEIRIFNGRCTSGNYGIYADAKGYQKINNIKIYNVGIDGVTTGIYMANSCWRWSFMNMRYSEGFTTLIETVGDVRDFTFYGSTTVNMNKNTFSNTTFGVFYVPVYDGNNLVSAQYLINNGSVVPDSYNTLKRFTFVPIRYNDSDRKTVFEHGIIPQTNGMYYILLSTYISGDASSIYICRVNSGAVSSFALHEGTNYQSPRIDSDGIVSKLNSTSTTSIYAYSIKLS